MVRGKRTIVVLAVTAAVVAAVVKERHLVTPQHVATPTLYVSTHGIDQGSCTSSQPCATLAYASHVASAGDLVLVEHGVYGPQVIQGSGKPGAQLTIAAQGRVILRRPANANAALQSTPLLKIVNSNYVTVRSFRVIGMKGRPDYIESARPYGGEVGIFDYTGPIATTGHGVIIENLVVKNANNTCIKTQDAQSGVTIRQNQVVNCGQPGNLLDHGIYASGPHTLIARNVVQNVSGYGIHCYGVHATNEIIRNNKVSGAHYGGIFAEGRHTVITGNRIFYNGWGIAAGPNSTISHNTIAYNDAQKGSLGVGLIFDNPGHDKVVNNIFYRNGFAEVYLAVGRYVAPITVTGNTVDGSGTTDHFFNLPAPPAGSVIDYNTYYNIERTHAGGSHSRWIKPHLNPTLG